MNMKINRRCEDCESVISYVPEINFCPKHGKEIKEFNGPVCDCGTAVIYISDRFCGNCGRNLWDIIGVKKPPQES